MGAGRARIAASILDADLSNLGHAVRRVVGEGADRIHLDIMDGHFVPNLTFGAKTVKALRRHTEAPFDAHLMIAEPGRYVDEFIDAGCDSITFHVEVDPGQIAPALGTIRAAGRAAGLALRPATPLTALAPYQELLDIVMVMTVEPGFGGQSFMHDIARDKVLAARTYLAHKPVDAEVHVDGGVNRETAELVGGLGADVLVVGSVLWIKGHDMAREIRLVRALADEGFQYQLNDGVRPVSRDRWVGFASLPRTLARRFMAEIEAGDIPVLMLRGDGRINPDGVRDYELLVPAEVEDLAHRRHAAARERYAAEAEAWRATFARGPDDDAPAHDVPSGSEVAADGDAAADGRRGA